MRDILNSGTFVIRANLPIDAAENGGFGREGIHVDVGFVLTLDFESDPAEETVDYGGE